MLRRLNHRARRNRVLRNAHLRPRRCRRANRLHRQPVRQSRMVRHLRHPCPAQLQPRRMLPVLIAQLHKRPQLVRRHVVLYLAAQLARHIPGIVGKPPRHIRILPSALVLQRLRKIPVVQRRIRLNPRRQQRIQHPVVEVQPLRIRIAPAIRKHTRPRQREPVRLQPQPLHNRNVFRIPVVVVVRHIACVPIRRLPRRMAEGVPHARSTSVFLHRAFHLVARRCRPPQEPLRKMLHRRHRRVLSWLIHRPQARQGKRSGCGTRAKQARKRTSGNLHHGSFTPVGNWFCFTWQGS